MLPAVHPEDEPDHDRQDEMHEVQDHRNQVLWTDHSRAVEGVLQN